jgi:phosphogluconate dehydratase
MVHPRLAEITARIEARSAASRSAYLSRVAAARGNGPSRARLGCANQAHGFAACAPGDKAALAASAARSLAIVTAYNDMLSAHAPYEHYPEIIRQAARAAGGVALVAGGVPAMCDGVTQGEAGMELSLFSRDVIALATAVALSHNTFDAAVFLGVCDKIVPGLFIGAAAFGHLPALFIPAGPMTSGLSNDEKAKTRQLFAEGKVGRAALLEAESKAYHGQGTCTFYGTANTNQMMMEVMGLHLPGAAFVNPGTPLREALTAEAARSALALTVPLGAMIGARSFVNAVVALHASGGSTNHTLHLLAMAAAVGLKLTWQDLADLAEVTPLLCRIYPNGAADVNHFHAAGGTGFLIRELLSAGLLHPDAPTVRGDLTAYTQEPALENGVLVWRDAPARSGDETVLRPAANPFQATGGLRLLHGGLGQAVIKTSAIKPHRHVIEAPARVFHSQEDVQKAFKAGELNHDVVVVVRFNGPNANGMPELHKLMPPLGVLQDKGFKVALVTDGRLSGASGKVPAAIHVTPEAEQGGMIARVQDGDIVRLDAVAGTLTVLADLAARSPATADLTASHEGTGRELFGGFRALVSGAAFGASIFGEVK